MLKKWRRTQADLSRLYRKASKHRGSGILKGLGLGAMLFIFVPLAIHPDIWTAALAPFMFLLIVWLGRSASEDLTVARKIDQLLDDEIQGDDRPPVLYLRSFEDDSRTAEGLTILQYVGHGWGGTYSTTPETEEEQIATVMNEIGKFKALGQPNEPFPKLGASREYARSNRWKTRVRSLMAAAILVVIKVGATRNLLWEIREARRIVLPERVILLVSDRKTYDVFRAMYETIFPHGLPDYKEGRGLGTSTANGIIAFDNTWQPCYRPLVWSFGFDAPLTRALRVALEPVFNKLSVR